MCTLAVAMTRSQLPPRGALPSGMAPWRGHVSVGRHIFGGANAFEQFTKHGPSTCSPQSSPPLPLLLCCGPSGSCTAVTVTGKAREPPLRGPPPRVPLSVCPRRCRHHAGGRGGCNRLRWASAPAASVAIALCAPCGKRRSSQFGRSSTAASASPVPFGPLDRIFFSNFNDVGLVMRSLPSPQLEKLTKNGSSRLPICFSASALFCFIDVERFVRL